MTGTLVAMGIILAMAFSAGWALVRFGRRDQQATQLRGAIGEIEVVQEVQRETAAMSNSDIARELHDKWTRKE